MKALGQAIPLEAKRGHFEAMEAILEAMEVKIEVKFLVHEPWLYGYHLKAYDLTLL